MAKGKVLLLAILALSAAMFLPLMGHGFVLDDFVLVSWAANLPGSYGLGHAYGSFYTPIGWLSFKLDSLLWGPHAFPFAVSNLIIHAANIVLVYYLTLHLWSDCNETAALWAALGFSLLFPANVWAVMWIATRAHLLATFFWLSALLATVWYSETRKYRAIAAISVVLLAAMAMLSKESGVTAVAAIAVVLAYRRQTANERISLADTILFIVIVLALVLYFVGRAQTGSNSIRISDAPGYSYSFSLRLLLENLLRYTARTYGLLALLGCALVTSLFLRGRRSRPGTIWKREALISILLFCAALTPFALLRAKSGIYNYLPGSAAALTLGAIARAFDLGELHLPKRHRVATFIPVLAAVLIGATFTVTRSSKWKRMAETNGVVLKQIKALQPAVEHDSFVVLRYNEVDQTHRFPESFGTWTFPDAIRLLYGDRSLSGMIARAGEPYRGHRKPMLFDYTNNHNVPLITRGSL